MGKKGIQPKSFIGMLERGTHIEYHTVNPKKEKAANCIYLDKNRICRNEHSIQYLEKCFIASHCKYREKETLNSVDNNVHPVVSEKRVPKYAGIKCTIPKNCPVESKWFGKGRFIKYNEENSSLLIRFGQKVMVFKYPETFLDKHIIFPQYAIDRIMSDIAKVTKE